MGPTGWAQALEGPQQTGPLLPLLMGSQPWARDQTRTPLRAFLGPVSHLSAPQHAGCWGRPSQGPERVTPGPVLPRLDMRGLLS